MGEEAAPPVEPSTRLENGPTRAHSHELVVELDQGDRDHVTIDAQFRLDSGEPGVLRVDFFWNGRNPGVESEFSVSGVPHVWADKPERPHQLQS